MAEIQNNQNINLTCFGGSFVYEGNVKVSLMKDGKKYFTKEYKNEGRWPLFYFLNLCLAGDYTVADEYRPRFINLFDFGLSGQSGEPGEPVPNIHDDATSDLEKLQHYFNSDNCVSLIAYPFMSKPDVRKQEKEDIGSSTITFKFTVPFTQISLKSHRAIEGFALYCRQTVWGDIIPNSNSSLYNPLVYVFLTDTTGKKVANLLDNLQGVYLGDEYNLYIEWTLTVTNQNTAVAS